MRKNTGAATPTYAAPAASKLLDILELLVEAREGLNLSEISRRLAIPTNSVFRICRVLEERGYVRRDTESGLFTLTTLLYTLGARLGSRISLIDQARPHLHWLTEHTGENAHLHILREDHSVLLAQCVCHHPVRVMVEIGSLLYPHADAFGKVILAHLPPAERQTMRQKAWPRLTIYTKTDPVALAQEWDEIAAAGIAYDFEEYQIGVRCVGAPVFDAEGRVIAGIGVMGPSYRLTPEALASHESHVRTAAARLSQALGAHITLPLQMERDVPCA